ncbi:DUF6885 family protein [Halomicronema sp. CCY15110]|uniref:DUF6885 family protein n=1 Tax=Halomicronema sp. CCY15110 TaxID=2767773 RepID=UPI0019525EE8|nr:hypothetical protein [Halomicronema sp. CCY15110]
MQLNLTLYPYLEALLPRHEKAGQQPDNLCGPYWVALLLQAYGQLGVSAVEVALAASTLLPSQGDPENWLPPGATSRFGAGYDRLPTVPNLEICGTAITGLMQATEQLSHGRFCLLPLQINNWIVGLASLFDLCQTHPEWQAVPLLNVHTSYFWGSRLTPLQLLTYLQGEPLTSPAADWKVGHFALLAGQLQGDAADLYAVLDTYPHFGWQGLHLQPPAALAAALQRPDLPTEGGIALFIESERRSQLIPLLEKAAFRIEPWDNGTPDSVKE